MRNKAGKTSSRTARVPSQLPDRLARDLDIVSIGINPSVYTAIHGFNFARPGNRFWPTFNAAGFVTEALTPGKAAVLKLLREHRVGFTDIVKHATDRADQLTDDDYRRGALVLKRKLLRYQPKIAWFQGTSAFQKYLEFAEGVKRRVAPGLQPERIGASAVFVTPNPSGANPAANPKLLLPRYAELKRLRDELNGPSAARSAKRRY